MIIKEYQMTRYKNLGGKSGIVAYEYGDDYIRVEFKDGARYLYTYESADPDNIEEMKQLAENGQGLNSFINRIVRKRYAKKEN